MGTVRSTCEGQAPTLPKGGNCQIHLHRPSPHLGQGWGLPNPLAQAKPPSWPRVRNVKSSCTGQPPTLPQGGNCEIHLPKPSPHLAQGWGLSNPLAQGKPPSCPKVGTFKSTCTGQAPTLPKGGNCHIQLQRPSPHLAQGWELSNPLARAKRPSCPKVGTVKSTCTGQAPTLPKGADCEVHLHRPTPHLAQGWELSNPLKRAKPPSCPKVGTVKSTWIGRAPTLPKGGDCQIHLHMPSPHLAQGWGLSTPLAQTKPPCCPRDCPNHWPRPSPHLAQGWGLSNPLAQAKPPPCPRVGTVKSTCTGPPLTLPKGGNCRIHLHGPSPHLAQGWGLSNQLAQAKPPSCPRVGTFKSTCTGQAPALPKGGDCHVHLHRPSPHLAQGWGLSNPLAHPNPPPCPRVGTVKSTCTGQAPILPKGGDVQLHLHRPSPHLAQGWGLSNALAQGHPPPCPRVETVKSTCKGQAPILPKGGDCQIHLHKPTPHLAQGWGLSNPLAQAQPPPCLRVGTVKSTCTSHWPRPSPHLAQGWGLSNRLAQAKPPSCPRVGTVKSTCTSQPPTLPKCGDCQIHLNTPNPHLAEGWELSNPLAQAKPPRCPRVGTVKSTCTGQAPILPKGGDCQIHLHKPTPHLAQGWGLSGPLAQAHPPPCLRVGTV